MLCALQDVEQHPWPLPARCQEQFPHRDNHRYLQALSLSPVEHKSALVSTPITSYLDHSCSLSVSACFLPVTSSWESSLRNVNLIPCPVTKSCLTLQRHELCSPPGSSSLGLARQEYWERLPFLLLRDLPDPGIKPTSPASAGGFSTTAPPGNLNPAGPRVSLGWMQGEALWVLPACTLFCFPSQVLWSLRIDPCAPSCPWAFALALFFP